MNYKALPAGPFKVCDSKQREESGSWRGSGPGPPKITHKSPLCKRSRLCPQKSGQGHPVPLTTRNAWEVVSDTSHAPMSPASTGSCPRLLSGRVWSCRLACKGWPACSHSTVGTGSPVAQHRRTRHPRISLSPPGAAPETQGHRWEAPGQLLGTFCYFSTFK